MMKRPHVELYTLVSAGRTHRPVRALYSMTLRYTRSVEVLLWYGLRTVGLQRHVHLAFISQ